ncbi:MAG: winged helix-turn-helix transcriptional regulator [Acidimicrobiales bacterium]
MSDAPNVENAGVSGKLLADALERIGDRWMLLVIGALLEGPRRFGELQQSVPGVATNVLSGRLRELERQGLVIAEPYSTRPMRLEYRATARAAELGGVLRLLAAWGSGATGDLEAPAHAVCGTALEVRYWCPTCQQVVDEDEEVWL